MPKKKNKNTTNKFSQSQIYAKEKTINHQPLFSHKCKQREFQENYNW